MSRRISAPDKAFALYAAMTADERRELAGMIKGFDRANGATPDKPKRGRPAGSRNSAQAPLLPEPEATA